MSTQSVVLIRGQVVNYKPRQTLSSLRITSNAFVKIIENSDITSDGQFRVPISLVPGDNPLNINYCCANFETSINFAQPENAKFLLRIVYIVCQNHDGCFQSPNSIENSIAAACDKINVAIRLVQCLYAEMLAKHGFDRKSFEFIECEPFYSNLSLEEARRMDQYQLWNYHAKEMLVRETDTEHRFKYFGILASTRYENGVAQANAALGVGDVALVGSGTLYAWPMTFDTVETGFHNDSPVGELMDDSNGRGTYGGCFATALGSMCHEIGHIFDLGHTIDGIMGNDIDYVNRVFTIDKSRRHLPRRTTPSCLIQSSCKITSGGPDSRRLTTINKSNAMLTKYHSRRNDDLTFLTENGALLLNAHKWFNQCDVNGSICYDFTRNVIISSLALVLVEFRAADNGLCIKYYRFDVSNGQNTFKVPDDMIQDNYDIIAVDCKGNINKCASRKAQ